MRYYLTKAIQDDSRRSGERDRLLLEARRAEVARRPRTDPAAPVRRLVQLLFRQADRPGQRARRWSTARPQALRCYRAHRTLAGHEVLVDDGAAAEQASPPLAPNRII
jgi:hypothetical protein